MWGLNQVVDTAVSLFPEVECPASDRITECSLLEDTALCQFSFQGSAYELGRIIVFGMCPPCGSETDFPMANPTSGRLLTAVGNLFGINWVDL